MDYFEEEADYFIDVYEERRDPRNPPWWSDGGDSAPMLINSEALGTSMSGEASASEEVLSVDEATELLADATDSTPEEISEGAEEIDIRTPEEATLVDE